MAAQERNALSYCALSADFFEHYVPLTDFDIMWASGGDLPGSLRYDLFITYYGLELGTAEPFPDEIIDVYYIPYDLLLQLQTFILDTGGICEGDGYLTAFPEQGFDICEE